MNNLSRSVSLPVSARTCGLFLLLFLLFAVLPVIGQKVPMKFGKIDPALFEMKSYAQDTSAEAVILGDYGEASIILDPNRGWTLEYTRHFRAKIFKVSGYNWASQNIFTDHSGSLEDQIIGMKGSTYNMENGKVIKSELERNMVFVEKVDNKRDEHKFKLPNVQEGSIIEYTYTIRSNYIAIPDWQFQYSIPAFWSEYRVSYPEYFFFKQLARGYLGFAVNENSMKPVTVTYHERENGSNGQYTMSDVKYSDHFFRWAVNNVPAFNEEPDMNAAINYVSMIEFELGSYRPPQGMMMNFSETWEKINDNLLKDEDFGMQLNRGGFLKDVVADLKVKYATPLERMIACYDFVKNNMKWNGLNRKYVTRNLKSAYDDRSGSSADINLMLVLLLREMGLNADPVILSTRSNGMLHPAQVMLTKFNYVIANVTIGDNSYLLDATLKECPYNILPSRCINGQGRIISATKPGWIDLNPEQKYEHTTALDLTVDNDGLLKGSIQTIHGKYAGLIERMNYADEKSQEDFVRNLESTNQGLSISDFAVKNLDSLYLPLIETYNIEIADVCQITPSLISFNPMLYNQIESNPYKIETRNFPVDFIYPRSVKYILNLTIPEGYMIDEKPTDIVIALAEGKIRFIYKCIELGNHLQIFCTLDINKPFFISTEYEALKNMYTAIVKKQAEMIVLKKI